MRNYKKIRQQPYIYGFTLIAFLLFIIIGVGAILTLLMGFSLLKCIVIVILIGINFLFCRHVLSSDKVQEMIFDKKLPKKYSIYE